MTTITSGTTTITPTLVDGYTAGQDARTISHPILGTGRDDLTLRPAGPRSGTLHLLFSLESAANTARIALSGTSVWTFTDPDRTTLNMSFAVEGGTLSTVLEDQTRNLWFLEVPFREVLS